MAKPSESTRRRLTDSQFKRDLTKVSFLAATLLACALILAITPGLSTPVFISVILTLLLSPLVTALERRGYRRQTSIILLFAVTGITVGTLGYWGISYGVREWDSLKRAAPTYFNETLNRVQALEAGLKSRYQFLKPLQASEAVIRYAESSWQWAVENAPSLMGKLLSCLFLVPILSFVLLSDGRAIKKKLFELVPNRLFETVYLVTTEIFNALADYMRAKLVEAFLVGLMTWVGLILVGAPYATVLAAIAGITNVVPYVGPIVGAIPGVMIPLLDPSMNDLLWPIAAVYCIANLIDMAFVFPIVVAKLVDLHPLVLIVVVMLGQRYYGLVGMLISIPLASAVKVVIEQVYRTVYEQRSQARANVLEDSSKPVLTAFENSAPLVD